MLIRPDGRASIIMKRHKAKNKVLKNPLFPSESVVFKTGLTGEQVIAKLAESIEAEKPFRFRSLIKPPDYSKHCIRSMRGNSFEIIKPFVHGFASSLTIDGTIHEDRIWTKVYVKMKLDPMINKIYIRVFGIVAVVFIAIVLSMIAGKEHFSFHDFGSVWFLVCFLMFPFIFLYHRIVLVQGLKAESLKSKKVLREIFEAEIEECEE